MELKAALLQQGLIINTSTPAQLSALIRRDLVRRQKVVKDAKIQPD